MVFWLTRRAGSSGCMPRSVAAICETSPCRRPAKLQELAADPAPKRPALGDFLPSLAAYPAPRVRLGTLLRRIVPVRPTTPLPPPPTARDTARSPAGSPPAGLAQTQTPVPSARASVKDSAVTSARRLAGPVDHAPRSWNSALRRRKGRNIGSRASDGREAPDEGPPRTSLSFC
jgi:hypothetical protein